VDISASRNGKLTDHWMLRRPPNHDRCACAGFHGVGARRPQGSSAMAKSATPKGVVVDRVIMDSGQHRSRSHRTPRRRRRATRSARFLMELPDAGLGKPKARPRRTIWPQTLRSQPHADARRRKAGATRDELLGVRWVRRSREARRAYRTADAATVSGEMVTMYGAGEWTSSVSSTAKITDHWDASPGRR